MCDCLSLPATLLKWYGSPYLWDAPRGAVTMATEGVGNWSSIEILLSVMSGEGGGLRYPEGNVFEPTGSPTYPIMYEFTLITLFIH